MELIFSLILFATFFVAMGWYGIVHEPKQRRALWSSLATRYQGQLHLGHGLFSKSQDYVLFTFQGVEVKLDQYVVSQGKRSTTYTRTSARVNASPRFTAQVYKETAVFSALGKALGGQDIELGDAEFDRTFIIKANDEGWMRRKLGAHEAIRDHLRQHDLRMALEHGYVTITRVGSATYEQRVMDQVRLTAYYAQAFGERPQLQAPTSAPAGVEGPTHTAW